MWCKFQHKIIIEIARPIFWLIFKMKYNCHLKKNKLPKEGSIVLSNHQMTLDPFGVGLIFNKPLYYMASSDLFQNKIAGKLIKFAVNPIPKQKSNKTDIAAIKACMQIAKENGNICIFPEGNRTFSGQLGNIDYSIVKLIKKLKKPLILVNIKGGYGTDPRWSNKSRKGKLDIFIRKKVEVEEIENLSNDELYALIKENLTVDNYSEHILYKGKNLAEDLERILYICPICNKQHTLSSKGDILTCSSCSTEFKYNEDLSLTSENNEFKFDYIDKWYDYQIDIIKNKEYDESLIYQDEVELLITKEGQPKEKVGRCSMKLYKDDLLFEFQDEKQIDLKFDNIKAMTLVGKKKLNIYYKDNTYQVVNDSKTNFIKYMHLYYILQNRKEGIEDGFIGI